MVGKLEWSKILSAISFIVLVFHLLHLIVVWTDIPITISIHFMNGEPNKWGSKLFLLMMPAIGFLAWWLLGKLTEHPQKLNYINLTEQNREKQYKMAKKVIVVTQNLSFLTFIFANESFLRSATGLNSGNIFFFLSMSTLVMIPFASFYNLVWAARLKNLFLILTKEILD